jgi:hypothetical protein
MSSVNVPILTKTAMCLHILEILSNMQGHGNPFRFLKLLHVADQQGYRYDEIDTFLQHLIGSISAYLEMLLHVNSLYIDCGMDTFEMRTYGFPSQWKSVV